MTEARPERRPSLAVQIETWKQEQRDQGYSDGWEIGHARGTAAGVQNQAMLLGHLARMKFGDHVADELEPLFRDTTTSCLKDNLVEFAESIMECRTPAELVERVRRWA